MKTSGVLVWMSSAFGVFIMYNDTNASKESRFCIVDDILYSINLKTEMSVAVSIIISTLKMKIIELMFCQTCTGDLVNLVTFIMCVTL